jgi:MFS family permease
MCQGMVFGAIPVVVTAVSADLSGVLQATVTIGGLLGTAWPMTVVGPHRYVRLSAGFAVTLLPVLAAASAPPAIRLVAFATCLTVAGVFVTPVAVVCYRLVETATDRRNRTEAFAWLSTGQAVGTAAGSAFVGGLLTLGGPLIAVTALPLAAGCAAALGLLLQGRKADGVR